MSIVTVPSEGSDGAQEAGEPPSSTGLALLDPPLEKARRLDPNASSLSLLSPPPSSEKSSSSSTRSQTDAFRRRFFPQAKISDWNDWKWQVRNRIRSLKMLATILDLSDEELLGMAPAGDHLPVGITPYYASLVDRKNADQPLRKTVVPVAAEQIKSPEEADDPLSEDDDSPVPGLVHRYPDRVLFLLSGFCATYCRYCTRARMVGQAENLGADMKQWEAAIEYIERTPQIRDVLLSGGDPLTLSDEKLEWLLSRLRRIPHVEFLRIGTKIPAVLPQRVTPQLTRMLRKYHPLWMSVHYLHPDECTPESKLACERLADAGIPLGAQTVLLAGVNDDVETMKQLVHALLRMRVRPYYLYQCDPISGSAHFRTPISKGLEIIEGLRGHTTGYAVPTFVVDAPGGGGKIPLLPEYVVKREGRDWTLRNFEGRLFKYTDPHPGAAA